jgi:hypothetical protein
VPVLQALPQIVIAGWLLGLAAVPAAAAPRLLELAQGGGGAIRQIEPVVELALEDGGAVVLDGIVVPPGQADAAAAMLAPLLGRASLVAEHEAAADRYGRRPVLAATPDGISLQAALLEAGLALVRPLPDSDAEMLARLLRAERSGERRGRGLWRAPDRVRVGSDPDAAAAQLGRFVLLEGRVLQAGAQQRYFYLNFGPDWRTDTTARIDKDVLRAMQRDGFEPEALAGRDVRLRGTLFAANGPMLELWTHQGIDILP